MTVDERRTGAAGQAATVRLAVIDSDSGFLQVLGKRLEGLGWQHRVLASPVPLDAMVARRLNAVVVDLADRVDSGQRKVRLPPRRLPTLLRPRRWDRRAIRSTSLSVISSMAAKDGPP